MTGQRRIALIAAVAVVAVLAVWYMALWRPASRHLSAAHKAEAAATAKVGQLRSDVSSLQALKRHVPADRAALARLEAAVPANPDLDGALEQLNQAATSAGVALSTVGPGAPTARPTASAAAPGAAHGTTTPAATLSSMALTMTATGSYPQVMQFLDELAAMPRTVVVDQLSLSSGHQMSASISARIFDAGRPTP